MHFLGRVASSTANVILSEQSPTTSGISRPQPEVPGIGGWMVHKRVAKRPSWIREGEHESIAPSAAGCVGNRERRAEPIEPVHNIPAAGAVDPDEDRRFVSWWLVEVFHVQLYETALKDARRLERIPNWLPANGSGHVPLPHQVLEQRFHVGCTGSLGRHARSQGNGEDADYSLFSRCVGCGARPQSPGDSVFPKIRT
jgi:hypothetical protein